MTVQSSTTRADYTGNGVVTAFPVPFYFLDPTHLIVYKTDNTTGTPVVTTLTLNSDYTVSGAGVQAGGSLTMAVAPTALMNLSILRNVPMTQLAHYTPNNPFPSAVTEGTVDQLTMAMQQVSEVASRSVALAPTTVPGGVTLTLPAPAANSVIGWNSLGTKLVNLTQVAYQAITNLTSIFFNNGGTGAVNRTLQSKLAVDIEVSVADFGAVGNGTTDDTAAINAALTYVGNAGGGIVRIPASFKCLVNSGNINIPSRTYLKGPHIRPGAIAPYTAATVQAITGVIYLNPAYTIDICPTVGSSSGGVSGLYIFPTWYIGYAFPTNDATATALIANYSGTAVTIGSNQAQAGNDCYVGHCFIVGFNYAVYGSYCGRYVIEYILGDCNNGIYTNNVHDVGRAQFCHFWDFATTNNPNISWRPGTAYNLGNAGNDWSVLVSCFSFGYQTGFYVGSPAMRFIACGCDGYDPTLPAGSIGWNIDVGATDCQLIGCSASSHERDYSITNTDVTTMTSCAAWSINSYKVYHSAGTLNIKGGNFNGVTSVAGLYCGPSITSCTIEGVSIALSGTGVVYSIDPAAALKVNIAENIFYNSIPSGGLGTGGVLSTAQQVLTQSVWMNRVAVGGGNGPAFVAKYATGTTSSPAIVASGNVLGSYRFAGYDGAAFQNAGMIRVNVDGAPAAGSMPGKLIFSTTPTGSTSMVDICTIDNAGNFYPIPDNAYTCGAAGKRWSAIWAANGTIQTSDERTKTEIQDATLGLDFINALRPVSYKFKVGGNKVIRQVYRDRDGNEVAPTHDDARPAEIVTEPIPGKRVHWGFRSQQVLEAVPPGIDFGGHIITDLSDPDSEQGLRYEEFISPMVKAIQELTARVKQLENSNANR